MKTNSRNELSGKTVLVIGIVFIVTGISLGGLTALNVQMRERVLYDPNLSLDERARVDGSLRWWRELGARLSYPLAAVLFVGGLLTIALSVSLLRETERKRRFNEGVEP